jgi:hypothetical protein
MRGPLKSAGLAAICDAFDSWPPEQQGMVLPRDRNDRMPLVLAAQQGCYAAPSVEPPVPAGSFPSPNIGASIRG